ncbi:MAG TPA: gamma carbonic anhydrase family protein [Saprospiraceae bacterium]|nr:gamma carbonic anhydrase family protein [Saprospiraceae bacterium]
MAIITVQGKTPQIDPTARIMENATITGDVTIGKDSSVWFQVVIRGDVNKIVIGDRVNIQDGAIVHGTNGRGDTFLGNDVSIGHRAIVHGCKILGRALIGMGAIILDDAVIQEDVIIAAGAVIVQDFVCESGYIYAGVPAKAVKKIDGTKIQQYIDGTAAAYVEYSSWYHPPTP